MAKQYDFSKIREHSEARFAAKTLVGCGALVKIGGETVWESYLGKSSLEDGTPITPDSIYRMCSMSKPITGVAVMQLVEQHKIDLFDEIEKFIPELTGFGIAGEDENGRIIRVGEAYRSITVFDLLNHSSGLAHWTLGFRQFGEDPRFRIRPGDTLESNVPLYKDILLDNQPGAATGYGAQVAYDVLSRIVEVVSGMKYSEYLKKYVTGPLEMKDTGFDLTPEQEKRVVSLYEADGSIRLVPMGNESMTGLPRSYQSGAAAIFGTVRDYMNFAEMLRRNGEFGGRRILKECTVKLMSTPLVSPRTAGYNNGEVWGLSMRVINTTDPNHCPPLGTFGWSGAYGTHFIVNPAYDLTAVYCSNLTNAGGSGAPTAFEFERDIFDALKQG